MSTLAVVLMGVSGSGKTVVGEQLARQLGARFIDGDDYHPPANVEKMRVGTPLTDADRAPWLERLNAVLRHAAAREEPVVLACSALRAAYRERLADRLPALQWVHLTGSEALIAERLAQRQHRYMPASLLQSQFAALEPPTGAIEIDVSAPLETVVAQTLATLRAAQGTPADAPQVTQS